MNRLFFTGMVVNVALNLLLIPHLKAVGAGAAALSTQAFVLIGQMWIAKKELRLPTEWKQVAKIGGFALLVILVNWQLYQLPGVAWLLKFSAAIASGLLLALQFRLVRLKMLFDLAKG